MNLDEAIAHTLSAMKNQRSAAFGYDLAPVKVAQDVSWELSGGNRDLHNQRNDSVAWSSLFFEAAWELCRRGIVRPGVTGTGKQATSDGGYSLTTSGRAYIESLDDTALLLVQPGALAAALAQYANRFGAGFLQRSQEAIRCRNAEAWLACCSMVGAAAESVLLALAISKTGTEDVVLAEYSKMGGRQKVVNMVVGQSAGHVQSTLKSFAGIVSLWRDEAAHGKASLLDTANADEALRQLLHMCQWVSKEWDALTK